MPTGVLSDESIMEHCKIYRPIPMRAVPSIIRASYNKKLKYQVVPSRPQNFDTLAKSLARINHNDTIRENLEKRYNEQVKTALAVPQQITLPQRATAVNLQRSSSEAFTPMNTPNNLVRRAQMTPDTPARPMTFPRISIQELIDRRTPKPDDESSPEDVTPQPERMTADVLARREALVDSGIAARALQTPGRMVLRNRSIVSAAVADEEERARVERIRMQNQSLYSEHLARREREAEEADDDEEY